jgi:sugar phosphate permease
MDWHKRFRVTLVLLFLTLSNVLNFADRFLIQGFAVDICRDLQLSNMQFTLLTGFVFTGFYSVMGLGMGILSDRMHRPRLMAAGLFLWSLLTAATGATRNFVGLSSTRVFIGVGEATLTPAALGLLGDMFDSTRRAFASGFYYLGAPLGIGGAFIIAGTLGPTIGWRSCFYALGVLGMLMAGALLFLREPRAYAKKRTGEIQDRRVLPNARRQGALRQIHATLAASPALVLVIVGAICVIFAQGTFVLDQIWLVQERGFDKTHAQNISGTMFLVGGVLGAVLGGIGSDAMQARFAGGRLYFLALIYALGLPLGFAYRVIDPQGAAFLVCMFGGSIMLTVGYGAIFASVQDLVPIQTSSTMTAFVILCMTLFGTSPGNLFAGWMADFLRARGDGQAITHAVLLGLSPWVAAIPCFFVAAKCCARQDAGKKESLENIQAR